jgi:hypothetical protein
MRSDEVHASIWLRVFENKIFNTSAGLYVYDETTGAWTNNTLRVVSRYSQEIFVSVVKGDNKKTFMSLYLTALPRVIALAPKIKFLDIKKNRGYFLFNNGVLDCLTMEMKPFHEDYFFTRKINRDFDPSCLEAVVVEKLFNTAYTVPGSEPNSEDQFLFKGEFDTTKRDYFLEKLARGCILGGFDKEFLIALGETNCGKGVLTQFIEHTFGGYVDTFNTTRSESRKSAWMAKWWDRRLVIGNEIPKTTENPVEMMAFLVILANDQTTAHCDRGFSESALIMYIDRCSTKEDHFDETEYFEADTFIKEFIREMSVQNAFVSVMCKYFQHSVNHGKLPTPDFVKLAEKKRKI